MALQGWYDLWLDRHLVFRPVGGGPPPEDSVISWPMDPTDRATAYTLAIEAAALDAFAEEVAVFANHCGMDDADALEYVRRELPISCAHGEDGQWLAMAQGKGGTGQTVLLALQRLAVDLGYDGTVTFKNLCEGWRATTAEGLLRPGAIGPATAEPPYERPYERPTPTIEEALAPMKDAIRQYEEAVQAQDMAAVHGLTEYLERATWGMMEALGLDDDR